MKKVWGFSDGVNAYIWDGLDYFPIALVGKELIFYGYGEVDNSGTNTAAALGGAIGGELRQPRH